MMNDWSTLRFSHFNILWRPERQMPRDLKIQFKLKLSLSEDANIVDFVHDTSCLSSHPEMEIKEPQLVER